MRRIIIFLAFLMSSFPLIGQSAPPSPATVVVNKGTIAVVVNKSIITEGELIHRLRLAAINSGMEPTPANLEKLKPQMLRVMIDETLQRQAAEQHKIQVSDKDIVEAIALLERNSGMEKGNIERVMKENNIPISTLHNQFRANRMWIELIRAKYASTLQTTDWEVKQELKLQQEKADKVQHHLAEIVLLFDTPEQEERIKADLNRLMVELQKGAHFSALAQQFSQAPTAAIGGDMGWVTDNELGPEVQEVLSHMDPGQLSQPIRTPQSYILIGYIEKKLPNSAGQTLISLQQVLFPFPPNASEETLMSIMTQAEKIAKSAKSCSDLETRAKKDAPLAQSRSQEGILETMPGPLQKILQSLPVNKTSQPLLTEQGGLLIMVCSKKTKKTEPITEDVVRANLIERKLQRFSDRELRDIKRASYIDFRKSASTNMPK